MLRVPAPAPGGGRPHRRGARARRLLGAAQQCWDEACELAADRRRPQLPGVGARPHRHDRPDDGLRHHRHRARPRPLQGQEAGRRRHDVDRQPDRAPGPAPASATRRSRSPRSSPTSTRTSRSSAPRTWPPSTSPVFACSMGDNTIHYSGHVRMMAAVQPFISGAISKTVNMPEEATVEEVEQLHIDAWQLGVKAIAIYRDNCKVAQPLSTAKKEAAKDELAEGLVAAGAEPQVVEKIVEKVVEKVIKVPAREKLPAQPHLAHLRVPGRRLQGLRHRRRVRGRPPRRDLPAHLEAGLHPRRHHGRLRHLGELRPPVRRAAAGLRRDAHQHPLRAGRHDRRPGPADRQLDPRLHLPPPGGRLPVVRGARGAQHPHHRRAHPAHAARRRGDGHRDPPGPRRSPPTRPASTPAARCSST